MGWFLKKQKTKRAPNVADDNGYSFRRSRTLTGTSSANIRASAENKAQLKTDRLKIHEQKLLRLKLVRFALAITVFAIFIAYLMANYTGVPKVMFAQGNSLPNSVAYQTTINSYFSIHPQEHFNFLLKQPELEKYIQLKNPEISAIDTSHNWYGGKETIDLSFRKPLVVWQIGEQKYYVDDKGIGFTYNHYQNPAISVSDQSGIIPDNNGIIASKRFIKFLGKLISAVNTEVKGQVSDVVIPASTREVDLKLKGRNYLIKTNIDLDPLQQAENLKNVVAYLDTRKITPAEYVDLRVANQAVYK